MNSTPSLARSLRRCLPLLLAAPLAASALPVIVFSNTPLFLAPAVKPNLMIILDSSQSMDATMGGKVINGDDDATRGNIARAVLRSVLGTYRDAFNWGLTAFEAAGPSLYSTYPYYMGSSTTMVYTNDASCGTTGFAGNGMRCIANPETANGFTYITYERTGDDAIINDVLYTSFQGPQLYAVGEPATFDTYDVYRRRSGAGTAWAVGDFTSPFFSGPFGATDAGFTPEVANFTRQVFLFRGWGYLDNPTGRGKIHESVQADSAAHFDTLIALLKKETNGATTEIKNNSVFTPLAGSLKTVKKYFAGDSTPISQTCQRNFVVMATDGNPTARLDGSRYNVADWINTESPVGSGNWTYGTAQQDVFTQLNALRSTTVSATTYDIQTYIVGMGDSLTNPSSVAALNKMASLGGGYSTAFLGSDPAALTNAFQSIVGDIQAKTSAASSVALNGGSWNTGSSLYQAKFSSADWSGNLASYAVAASGVVAAASTWESAVQVKGQNWDTGRKVLTFKPSAAAGSRGIAFRWPANPASPTATELDTGQIIALNTNATATNDGFGSARLQYLRGNAAAEPRNCSPGPCAAPQFRNRNITPLGDIVNSSPYYVGVPNFGYYDDMESVAYSSFVSTYRTRTPMIYVGANDGMLHAINATTGAEALAYVPSTAYAGLSQLTDLNYGHRYLVDGSPTVGDVFYNGNWHSLLVSGLRAGGKGLFALDVTDPSAFGESNAAAIVRWEFQDADLGYVFGQPLLVKTNNGKWSVIVSGGYNSSNASGRAFLFIIDAETGALTRKISTGSGSAASPNGLSAAAAIDTNGDNVADVVYAGDLDGNLWKFDISSASSGSWSLGNGGSPLFTASNGQSITSRPDVTRFPGGGYMVAFGTGRYLAAADTTDVTAQAEYAIRDTLVNGTVTLAQLQQQKIAQVATGTDGNEYRLSTHAVGAPSDFTITGDNAITTLASYYSTKKGWYVNLPTAGERVVSDARFRGGRVVMTSLIPDVSSACAYGGSGWVMEFDAITGNRLNTATFDTNGDNTLGNNDFLAFPGNGASTNNTSGRKIGAIPAAPGFMGNKSGTTSLEDKYINTSEGSVVRVRETAGKGGEGRVMWREVR